jgi:hypothetical protein
VWQVYERFFSYLLIKKSFGKRGTDDLTNIRQRTDQTELAALNPALPDKTVARSGNPASSVGAKRSAFVPPGTLLSSLQTKNRRHKS